VGIELFERATESGGRILRVEQLAPADGRADAAHGPGYLLTFDVGRILVAATPSTSRLVLSEIPAADELGAQLWTLDEEEPWWRLAGCAVTRVWPIGMGEGAEAGDGDVQGVRLQFRADDENPRFVSLGFDDGGVRVALEDAHGQ